VLEDWQLAVGALALLFIAAQAGKNEARNVEYRLLSYLGQRFTELKNHEFEEFNRKFVEATKLYFHQRTEEVKAAFDDKTNLLQAELARKIAEVQTTKEFQNKTNQIAHNRALEVKDVLNAFEGRLKAVEVEVETFRQAHKNIGEFTQEANELTGLDDIDAQILELLKTEKKSLNASQIASSLGLGRKRVSRHAKKLGELEMLSVRMIGKELLISLP